MQWSFPESKLVSIPASDRRDVDSENSRLKEDLRISVRQSHSGHLPVSHEPAFLRAARFEKYRLYQNDIRRIDVHLLETQDWKRKVAMEPVLR